MDHVRASRFLATGVLALKFMVGMIAETLLLLLLITLPGDIQDLLLNFIIFVVTYEIPTFIFKLKQGQYQAKYVDHATTQREVHRQFQTIDQKMPGSQKLQRAMDVDLLITIIGAIMNESFMIIYGYNFFYMVFLVHL
jgi:hypothetical protein